MELGEVLSKAWKIIWKNKILWIFGILSSCGRGGGGGGGGGGNGGSDFNMPNNGDFNFENGENPFSNGQFPGMEEFGRNLEQMFGNGDQVPWGIVIGLICLIFFISFLFLFIQSIGRAGMIRGTVLADAGQEPLSFGQVWTAGSPYFVKLFLLNFLIGLAFLIATLILLVPLAFLGIVTMGIGLICIIPLLCLMVPIGWAVNVVIEQANVALVVENLGYIDAIKACLENLPGKPGTGRRNRACHSCWRMDHRFYYCPAGAPHVYPACHWSRITG